MVWVLLKKRRNQNSAFEARFLDSQGINSIFSLRNQNRLTLSLALAARLWLDAASPRLSSRHRSPVMAKQQEASRVGIGISYLSSCWIGVCLHVGPVGYWIGVCLRVGYRIGVCSCVFTFQFCFPFHLFFVWESMND